MKCDYRRVLDWSDLQDSLIQRVATLYSTVLHTHTPVATVTSSLPLRGSGFQHQTFPFLWVPELFPASATSFSQQQLTTTETQRFSKSPTGWTYSKSKLCYDRRSVSYVLVSSTHLGPKTRFLLLSDSCEFVDVGRTLWRWDGTVVYNRCWPSPVQSFSGPTRDSPNLEGQVPVFISPRNRVAQLYTHVLDSLFVASYDSQSYGGGIRTRLHAGLIAKSKLLYDWRFTANQFVLTPRPSKITIIDFFFIYFYFFATEPLRPRSLCNILSDIQHVTENSDWLQQLTAYNISAWTA
jgi:hypothetical protein